MNISVLKYGAVAIIVVAVLALTYRAGGSAPRAELRALRAIAEEQANKVAKIEVKQKEVSKHANRKAADVYSRIDDAYRLRHSGSGKVPDASALAAGIEQPATPDQPNSPGCTERDSATDAAHVLMLQNFYNEQRELINGL